MPMPSFEHAAGAPPERLRTLEEQQRRLQLLVGELLATNQELRFHVARLEERAESAERGLASACATAGLLLP
jgi:hypothetical protein